MVPLRDRVLVGGGDQRITLAQKTAQAGVDEPGLTAHRRVALGGLDGLTHQRERRIRSRLFLPRQRECGAQQVVHTRRRIARSQLLAQRLRAAQLAQCLEQQGLHAGTQTALDLFEHGRGRLALAHGLQALGGRVELLPQGDALLLGRAVLRAWL